MGREKEFNTILDTCLDRLMFKGDTLEQCLAGYPEYAEELKPLLEASLITRQVALLGPDQQFKARARNELFAVLEKVEEKRNRRRSFFVFGWQPRWASVVAVAVALLIATGGTAAASMGSMPDDFLYPLKRATEQVQLAFTFTNLGKAEAYARMANRRVEEIIYLANENDIDKIEVLATSLDSSLNNIAEYSSRKDIAIRTTADEGAMLFEKAATTEEAQAADSKESLTAAGSTETDEDEGAEEPSEPVVVEQPKPEVNIELPPSRITIESPTSKGSLTRKEELNITVINQASTNLQRLYELLGVVSESTREIILKAIEIAERGYGIAIDSLNVN